MISRFSLLLLGFSLIISCSSDEEEMITPPSCDTSDMSFQNDILPIFNASCLGCHSSNAAFGGVILDVHQSVKTFADNGSLVGSINHNNGFSPMPQGSPMLSDCNIDKIESWVQAGAQDN